MGLLTKHSGSGRCDEQTPNHITLDGPWTSRSDQFGTPPSPSPSYLVFESSTIMATTPHHPVDIVDVRRQVATNSPNPLREDIIKGLSLPTGQKALPTMLLYDEHGLRLYDAITTDAPEYYLFPAEEEILKAHGDDIARSMHAGDASCVDNETVIELGAG